MRQFVYQLQTSTKQNLNLNDWFFIQYFGRYISYTTFHTNIKFDQSFLTLSINFSRVNKGKSDRLNLEINLLETVDNTP